MTTSPSPLNRLLDWLEKKVFSFLGKDQFQPIITQSRENFFSQKSFIVNKNNPEEELSQLLEELQEKALIFWQIPKKNWRLPPRQQLLVFLAIFLLASFGLFTDNLLLAILSILIGLIFWFFQNEPQEKPDIFGITEEGIFANNSFYDFSSLKSFWIFWEIQEDHKELFLLTNSIAWPEIRLPLIAEVVKEVRAILLKHLPEEKPEIKAIDFLNRSLKL